MAVTHSDSHEIDMAEHWRTFHGFVWLMALAAGGILAILAILALATL
ncbi:aa3-type cytochrome c oxidase subunit IV [Methyloligella sp. 2.7D]|nr:aa3-type cytochrome c oxidase subunit IV [Methyloligella sp. GL2]QKP76023.1 aa3-type cytochrome c oxidase subunit IV [Methyloligella sp. GL2]